MKERAETASRMACPMSARLTRAAPPWVARSSAIGRHHRQVWRSAILIEHEGCRAALVADTVEGRLDFFLKGEDESSRDRLYVDVRDLFVNEFLCAEPREEKPPSSKRLRTRSGRGRRGRPVETDPERDADIATAWATKQYKTYADLARAFKMEEKKVRRAVDRHRKRPKKP